eukprot:89804_1
MSQSAVKLSLGDVILFQTDDQYIGVIKYIGLIYGLKAMTQYVGVELMESIGNEGHSGTIDNYSYFLTKPGFGTHCKVTEVIQKLTPFEIFSVFKSSITSKNKRITKLESKMDPIRNNNKHKLQKTGTPIKLYDHISALTDYSSMDQEVTTTPNTPFSALPLTPTNTANAKNHGYYQQNSVVSLFSQKSMDLFPETLQTSP